MQKDKQNESPAQHEAPQPDRCPSCWVFSRWDKSNQRRCTLTHGGFDGTKESHIPFSSSCVPCSDPWHQLLSTSSQTPPPTGYFCKICGVLPISCEHWGLGEAAQTSSSETAQDERAKFDAIYDMELQNNYSVMKHREFCWLM